MPLSARYASSPEGQPAAAKREAIPCDNHPDKVGTPAMGRQLGKSQKAQACPKAGQNRRLHRYVDLRQRGGPLHRSAPHTFLFRPCTAHFSFGKTERGPRRAPRGGERRRKGAGAVFAAGGNGAERTLRRRQWGAHPPWKRPPVGAESPAAAGRRPARFPWSPRPRDFPPDQRGQEVDCPAGETSRSGMPGPAGSGTAPSAAPQKYLLKILPWTGTFSR